jgi:hypothetical protein
VKEEIAEPSEAPEIEAAPPAPTFHGFMNLPKELRLNIWALALQDQIGVLDVCEAVMNGEEPSAAVCNITLDTRKLG